MSVDTLGGRVGHAVFQCNKGRGYTVTCYTCHRQLQHHCRLQPRNVIYVT